ncbi:MAG: hypothetical protein K2K20_08085 [Lachnospiraceae bacterium]|nr:hypothetical protein [Lachnospiraceae bacterium]
MKKTAPVHIKKFCFEDNEDRIYRKLQEEIYDEVHFLWKIKCECGETKFKVFTDEHPSVFCKCSRCNKDITVYELSNYPAAVKLNEEFEVEQVFIEGVEDFNVYAIYEYSDEFEEDDDEFDPNGITWAEVYIGNGSIVEKIVDDETA